MASRAVLVRLVADATGAKSELRDMGREVKRFGSYTAEATVKIQSDAAKARLGELEAQLRRYQEQPHTAKVQIRMGTVARQIERTQAQLRELTDRPHEVKIKVSERVAGSVGGGIHAASGGLSGVVGGLAARLGSAGPIGAGAAAAGFGTFEIVKKLAEAYGQEQVSQARLRAQLKALNIDYDTHAKRIDEVIQRTSALSGLTGHDLNDAFVNIVRSTGKVGQSLKLVGLAADLARDKHLSAAKAGQLIAKVAAGNTSALGRYGIQIRKGATASEALGVLQQKLGGQAAAFGKTQQGALDRVQVSFERLKETLGEKLAPVIAKVANAVAKFITGMLDGRGAGGKFVRVIETVGHVLGAMAHAAHLAIAGMIERFRGGVQVIRGIVKIISGVLTGNFSKAWQGVEGVFRGGLRIIHGILEGAIAPFVGIGRALGSGFVNALIDVVNAGIKVLNSVLRPRDLGPFGHTPDLRIGEIGHVDFSSHPSGVKINSRARSTAPAGGDPRGVFSGGARTRRPARPAVTTQTAAANITRRVRQATIDAAPSIAAAVAHHQATPAARLAFGADAVGNRLATVGEGLIKQLKANTKAHAALLPRLTDVAYHPLAGRLQHAPTVHGLGAAGHIHHHEGATVQVTTPGGIQYPDAEYFAAALQRKLAAKGNG